MKEKGAKGLLGLLALVFLTSCPLGGLIKSPSRSPVGAVCQSDRDCVLAQSGCCGCSSSGESVAVHRSQVVEYERLATKDCGLMIRCGAWYRCWELKAVCESSQCKTVPCPKDERDFCIAQTQRPRGEREFRKPPVSPVGAVCRSDRDCVLAKSGCCGCSSGGESVAVHRSQAAEYERRATKDCDLMTRCLAWYRCVELKAVCENSQCKTVSCPKDERDFCIAQTQWSRGKR